MEKWKYPTLGKIILIWDVKKKQMEYEVSICKYRLTNVLILMSKKNIKQWKTFSIWQTYKILLLKLLLKISYRINRQFHSNIPAANNLKHVTCARALFHVILVSMIHWPDRSSSHECDIHRPNIKGFEKHIPPFVWLDTSLYLRIHCHMCFLQSGDFEKEKKRCLM